MQARISSAATSPRDRCKILKMNHFKMNHFYDPQNRRDEGTWENHDGEGELPRQP